jgi:aryl-alcohol dehydrogenase-like predicted oxidoreductase
MMMKYRRLGNTGLKLSVIGLGGSGYGNVYGKYDEPAAIKGVHHGFECGINYIDTAPWYGQGVSESFLGKALRGVQRQKFFIGTKVGRYERDTPSMFDFSRKKALQSAEESLRRLGLEYVDVLQVHDVEFAPSIDLLVNETIPALKTLKDRGLCRFIGITGYSLPALKEIVQSSEVNIDSVLSYCRLTLNDSSLLEYLDFFDEKQVGVINASPVSMGLLTGSTQPWHPASEEIKQACSKAVEYSRENGVDLSRIALNYSTNFEEVNFCCLVVLGSWY